MVEEVNAKTSAVIYQDTGRKADGTAILKTVVFRHVSPVITNEDFLDVCSDIAKMMIYHAVDIQRVNYRTLVNK